MSSMTERLAKSEANLKRIKHIEDCFGSSGQPLSKQGRVLVGEGVLIKLCRKKPKPRQFFLFNDVMVYGNILINKKKYNKQHLLPLEEVKLVSLDDDGKFINGWQIISPGKSFAVYAATNLEKQEWMAHINKSINELLRKTGKVPSGEQAAVWVPDQNASICMSCEKTKFSPIVRRHHCRHCGSVVCGQCSSKKFHIPHISEKMVRVCDSCYARLESGQFSIHKDHTDGPGQTVQIDKNLTLTRKEAEKITESGSSAEESDEEQEDSSSETPTFYEKNDVNVNGESNQSSEPCRPSAPPCGGSGEPEE